MTSSFSSLYCLDPRRTSLRARVLAPLLALAYLIGSALASPASASQAPRPVGTVTGRVAIDGLAEARDAVVWLEPLTDRSDLGEQRTATLDQRGLDFRPRVLEIAAGTTVRFLNSDTVLHNIFAPDLGGDSFDLGTWPSGEYRTHRFARPGVTTLLCNVHPEMEAFIVVLPTQWYAKSRSDGSFTIDHVPPGQYRLLAWHERAERSVKEIEVPAAGALQPVEILLPLRPR